MCVDELAAAGNPLQYKAEVPKMFLRLNSFDT